MTEVAVPKLTKEQYQLLLYMEQYYWRRGRLPDYETLVREGINYEESSYYEALTNPRFLDSLRGRGVPEHLLAVDSASPFNGRVLTEQQLTVANIMLDVLDKRSRLKKLTELGVSTAEYNSWLRDPVYRQYCIERAESLLEEAQPTAHLSLIDRVAQGDLSAIKYFNSMTGRFRERGSAAVEVNVQNNYGNTDMLVKIVEVIQKHVKDPALLEAIGNDILMIANPGAATSQPQPHYNVIEGGMANYGIGS